jgi:D-amino-acid dehydrogenase
MKKIAVVGAGITGLTAAYYLARAGHSVTVLDAERHPAMKCSYANGGQISVSNSEVWTTWSNVLKGVKWMLKKDAPLLIRPELDWDKAVWLAKFLYHTAKNDYERNTAETIRLGIESRKLYQDIIQEEKIDFNHSACGILHIYKDKKYFDAAKRVQELYQSNGCEWNILSPNEVYNLEKNLLYVDNLVGGVYTKDDSVGDIHKFCTGLEQVLKKKYKVWFQYDYKVDTILDIHNYDSFDAMVLSNGVGVKSLSKQLGEKLPVYPVKGYSITIEAIDIKNFDMMPKVSLLDDQEKIVSSLLGSRLRIAGTAELTGENYDILYDRIRPLLNWCHKNFPELDTSSYSSWACLRPMTPNMMPIVRQSNSYQNIYYHTGHGHLGWTLSPATAKQLVKLI